MAAILTIVGGIFGLFAAILSMLIFGAGPLVALSLWSATGLSTVLLALVWSHIPRRETAYARA